MSKEDPCSKRVRPHWKSRKDDFKRFMACTGDNDEFYEYGLCFDYVAPGTFRDQKRGYWRYQLSWGGPSDEIRFYGDVNPRKAFLDSAEYWFMDWGDGAKINVMKEDVVQWLWSHFDECGSLGEAYDKAMKDN